MTRVTKGHFEQVREGEGDLVTVVKSVMPQPDGRVYTEFAFDMATASVPGRRYHADTAFIVYEPELVRIGLGQRSVVGSKLRSLIVLCYPPERLDSFRRSCEPFFAGMKGSVSQRRSGQSMPLAMPEEEPSHVVSMAVNLMAAAYNDQEAVMDCYHLSAFATQVLKKPTASAVAIDPVVRVHLPTALLLSVLDDLFRHNSSSPR